MLPAGDLVTSRQHRRCFCIMTIALFCTINYIVCLYSALYRKLCTQSSAPEDGRNYRPKHVALIEITSKVLLLHLVGCLY